MLLFLIDVCCVVVGGGVIPFLSQAKNLYIDNKKTFPT
jgi:hypothetical protein